MATDEQATQKQQNEKKKKVFKTQVGRNAIHSREVPTQKSIMEQLPLDNFTLQVNKQKIYLLEMRSFIQKNNIRYCVLRILKPKISF